MTESNDEDSCSANYMTGNLIRIDFYYTQGNLVTESLYFVQKT